jgi:hypothetical protein
LIEEHQKSISFEEFADYWRYVIGVNVFPADTINKTTDVKWSPFQTIPIPEELHNEWKASQAFNKGMAVMLGRVWHNKQKEGLYLNGIDADNLKAIEEICTRGNITRSLKELANWTVVEQHSDAPNKAHIYIYSHKPFAKKSSDKTSASNNSTLISKLDNNEIPAIEVKGRGSHGIFFCSPSIHENGHRYEIIGVKEPVIADDFEQHIDSICRRYGLSYLDSNNGNGKSLTPIEDLFKPESRILEGHNRHEGLLRAMESLLSRNSTILPLEEIKHLTKKWNNQHCLPPLDDIEFEKQWKCAIEFIVRKTDIANGNKTKNKKESLESKSTPAEVVVELAIENTELLFKDQYGTPYALVRIADHNEIIRIESSKFKRYLSKLFYDNNGKSVVNADSISNAIQVLQAKAEYEGKTIPLSLRVAWNNQDIYYDKTDEKWQCIKISKENWELVSQMPTPLFVRYNQTPQAEPDRNYEPDIFDKFLALTNLKDDDEQNKILLKVYIISLFIPEIAHAILILHGEKGSAKSTLQTLIKLLVDPSKPALLTIHRDIMEFVQQLAHNYIAYYDNVKNTPTWLSDEACRAVTGIGQTKRKLYTDDDQIVYEYKHCLGFNGINIGLTEPDALDRSIMIELDRIRKENRKQESDILAEFFKLRPKLLGYIFDILVKTLQIKPSIKLNDLPRMADFALWGEAIARAMEYKELEFMQAYYDNIGRQNIEAIENHPLGRAIAKFYEQEIEDKSKDSWEGPPAKLLEQLDKIADEIKINTSHKSWPKEVKWLTRRLNQIRSNLLEGLGIEVSITRVTKNLKGKVNTSSIKIRKMSPMTPMTPVGQNHEGNMQENTGVILGTGDIMTPVNKMSPVENGQNHAQNIQIGETGETGDIFPISREEAKARGGRTEERQSTGTKLEPLSKLDEGRILQEQQQLNHNSSVVYSCRYCCGNFETDLGTSDYSSSQ